jgi:periplasmic protein TonB
MTTIEFNQISASATAEQARGWTASVLLHGLALASAFLFMAEIDKPVLREPFQWDVSMVEAPTHAEQRPSESPPVEKIVQPPPSPVKPKPPIRQATEPIAHQTPRPTEYEAPVAVEPTKAVTDVAVNAEPVVEPMESRTVSQVVMTEPIQSSSEPVIEHTAPVESTAPTFERRTVQYRHVRYRETRADYGWLVDMVRKRVEDLMRYPILAKANHWEGRVVVQAVVKADGTVGDLRVAESSGHALLDEDALVVMRKASPLMLKHQLEKSQITILVPIRYRLDG